MTDVYYVSFAEAASLFPGRPSINSVHRWRLDGVLVATGERVKLQAFRNGRRWYTTRAAIEAFLAAQNAGAASTLLTPTSRERELQAVDAQLAAAGV